MTARLAMPGLDVSAAVIGSTLISASLAMPGLGVTARPTVPDIPATELDMPGLALTATIAPYTYLSATLSMPGLGVSATAASVRDVAATLSMPGLAVPRAVVTGLGPAAVLVMPGLAVPVANLRSVAPTLLSATLAMPGLSVAALVTPPAGQFRLAPNYTLDWATLRAPIPAPSSVVQIGLPVSNGVRMSGHTAGASGELVGNVALASRNKSGPGWTGGFTLKRTDAFAPASGGGAAFLILGFGMVGDGSGAQAQLGPYPWSARYDPLVLSGSATSFGVNADQWPTTTYANGNVCAAWGDGNGFNNDQTRSSLGVSEISGTPPALTGVDKYLSGTTGVDNRKPNAILHIGTLVANNILLWHVNQTQDARVGTWTAISTNNGTAWTFHEANAERVFSTGATPKLQVIGAVQLGPGYAAQSSLIDNNYAYLYLNNSGNLSNPFTGTNGNIWMCRVKIAGSGGSTANIWDPSKYSFFNGLVSGSPTWTANGGTLDTSKTVAVFPGGMGKHFLVGWSEVNNRFFAALTPTASTVAVYEAPTPFGPWGTLYYGAGSDANWTGVFTASLPGPWQTISKLWLAVSGAPPDSLDVQSSPLAALSNVGRPADVAQWPGGMEPVSTEFRDHTTGARLTFFFNNNALGVDPPASAPALAVFNADGSVTAIAADNPSTVLNQARNFPFDYTLALSTASPPVLTLTQHDASVPTDTTITWTSALLATRASPSQGSFVWLCTPGRVAEITGESFTPPATPSVSATLAMPGLGVSAQVDSGSVGTGFPNGYAAVRRLVRSAQADLAAESTAALPSFIDTTEIPGDWSFLLASSNDLLSLDPTTGFPYDIRFTSDDGLDTKLDHQVVSYNPTAGTARFFVREPTGSTSDTDLRVLLYYGKAGLTATEERIAQVWQSAWLVIDPTSGADLTGKGHALTRSGSGLTNTTLDGRPAVLFAAAGYLRRTDPDLGFLDGLTDWTEAFWLKTPGTADGNVSRLGGDRSAVPPQPFPAARFATWVELSGSVGGGASVIEVGSNRWNTSNYDNLEHESVVNAADGTTVRHLIVVREKLKHIQLYDGEADIGGASTTGTPTAGTLHPQSTDNYSLGAGLGAQTTAPAMTLGLYALFPKALSATWRAMLDRTQRDSSLCWAVGAEDTYQNADNSPVGKPWRDSITAQTDYTAASHAYDPDAGAILAVTAVTPNADLFAAYSIPPGTGKLRVAPISGGQPGVGRPVVTLSDGTKTAKVKPYISISGVVVPPGGYYKDPPPLANKVKVVVTTRAQLVAADATFASGGSRSSATHYISIEGPIGTGSNPDDSSKGSTLRLVGGGTRAAPYVITSPGAGSDNWTARASYKVFNTELELRQPWTWLYGLWTSFIPTDFGTFNTTDGSINAVTISAANCFVTACRITGSKGVYHEKGGGAHAAATVNFNWFEMYYQSSASKGGGDMSIDSEQGGGSGHDWIIARNRSNDHPNGYSIVGAGGAKNARFVYISPGLTAFLDWVIEYNFMDAGHSHYMEFKSGIKSAKWNHGTGTNNPYGGIYYRGDAPGGGEISYNRLTCQQTNMNGPNTLMVSNWHINSGGAVNGVYGLTAKSTKQSAQLANDLAGADGSIFVACKANILMPYYFEYSNYHPSSPLGKIAPIFFYGHLAGSFQYGDHASALGAAGTLNFDGSGHPTNGGSDIYQPGVTKQSSIPSRYNPQTPPILDETVCGPAAPGLTWS